MIPVILESPYAANTSEGVENNLTYLRACMRHCLENGEAPFASHGLYTQPGVLDDKDPHERVKGLLAAFQWYKAAHKIVVYTDLGISKGMEAGITRGSFRRKPIVFRTLGGRWASNVG